MPYISPPPPTPTPPHHHHRRLPGILNPSVHRTYNCLLFKLEWMVVLLVLVVPFWSTHGSLGKQIFQWKQSKSSLQSSWRNLWRNWSGNEKHQRTARLWRQTWRELACLFRGNNTLLQCFSRLFVEFSWSILIFSLSLVFIFRKSQSLQAESWKRRLN